MSPRDLLARLRRRHTKATRPTPDVRRLRLHRGETIWLRQTPAGGLTAHDTEHDAHHDAPTGSVIWPAQVELEETA